MKAKQTRPTRSGSRNITQDVCAQRIKTESCRVVLCTHMSSANLIVAAPRQSGLPPTDPPTHARDISPSVSDTADCTHDPRRCRRGAPHLREASAADPGLAVAEVHVQQPSRALELEVRRDRLGDVGARAVQLRGKNTHQPKKKNDTKRHDGQKNELSLKVEARTSVMPEALNTHRRDGRPASRNPLRRYLKDQRPAMSGAFVRWMHPCSRIELYRSRHLHPS